MLSVLVLCVYVDAPLLPVVVRVKGILVAFVRSRADGIPKFGVVIAQLVVMQKLPVPLIPVQAQVALFEDGAPKSITLFALGTELGDSRRTEVVMVAGAPNPKLFAGTVTEVPAPMSIAPALPLPTPLEIVPGVDTFPLVSSVVVADGV
jgi:hypothetical protein